MNKDDGGPAYPAPEAAKARFGDSNPDAFLGMSLRDYFAASVISGLTAHPRFNPIKQPVQCAKDAYAIADAMLAARSA